jgi:cation transport protein ChaC
MSEKPPLPYGKTRLEPPDGADFWVFGYGSLIWRPGFPHTEVQVGLLRGYHRRFCVYSNHHRGTPEKPGLVLGLAPGGSCRGLVYRVPAAEGEAVMDYLHEREMVTGVYDPGWLKVDTSAGRLRAAGFVVDTEHPQYAGRLSNAEAARYILQGEGKGGPCLDYLRNTVHHLEALDMHDRALHRLLHDVEAAARIHQ